MNHPTLKEYLEDFKLRCENQDKEVILTQIINGECPFLGCNLTKDEKFRIMRRYYRRNLLLLKPYLFNILNGGD